jgi:membrane protein YqaA with SNARE-associated domain
MGTIYQLFYILYRIFGGSEAVLVVLQFNSAHNVLTLLAIATAGNTPGGLTSWLIGKLIARRWPTQKLLKPEFQREANWLENHCSPLTRNFFNTASDPSYTFQ